MAYKGSYLAQKDKNHFHLPLPLAEPLLAAIDENFSSLDMDFQEESRQSEPIKKVSTESTHNPSDWIVDFHVIWTFSKTHFMKFDGMMKLIIECCLFMSNDD